MNRLITLLCLLATSVVVQAQGTTQFTVDLRGNSDHFGEGTFILTGSSFVYDVRTDWGFDLTAIHGPAESGTDAPKIFDLSLRRCDPPIGGLERGGCFYSGNITLSPEQTTELLSGQWYVYSTGELGQYFLRGQISLVPEPRLFGFFALTVCLVLLFRYSPSFCPRPLPTPQTWFES
jgi:hypothetical protein